jgi:hypothetical protein
VRSYLHYEISSWFWPRTSAPSRAPLWGWPRRDAGTLPADGTRAEAALVNDDAEPMLAEYDESLPTLDANARTP